MSPFRVRSPAPNTTQTSLFELLSTICPCGTVAESWLEPPAIGDGALPKAMSILWLMEAVLVRTRRATEPDQVFIVEMSRLASVIEDRPLPTPDSEDVTGKLPGAEDRALVAVNDGEQLIGAAWWYFHDPPLLTTPEGAAIPELIVGVVDTAPGPRVGPLL